MNNVSLIGRLTQDPELRTTSTGLSNCRFSLAVDGRTNSEGERTTNFINVVAWRAQAENLCKYCSKGSQVAVTGYIQTGSYTAQDGTKRYTTDVVANQITFLGSKSSNDNEKIEYEVGTEEPGETIDLPDLDNMGDDTVLSDEELPF